MHRRAGPRDTSANNVDLVPTSVAHAVRRPAVLRILTLHTVVCATLFLGRPGMLVHI